MIIKDRPDDFIVEEIPLRKSGGLSDGLSGGLGSAWDDAGEFCVFKLTKIDLNTEQAMEILSRKFHIPLTNIKYAGTKDKRAVTTQYISIPNKQGVKGINLNEGNLKLEHVGYSDVPLSLGTLKGNRFIITVRDPTDDELKSLESKQSKNLADTGNIHQDTFIIPNYFDDQRFSKNNLGIGIAILKKEYAKAVELLLSDPYYDNTLRTRFEAFPNDHIGMLSRVSKKILLMFIHSVQSYIFNEALSRMLIEYAESDAKKEGAKISAKISYYAVDYSLGKLIFYANTKDYARVDVELFDLPGFNSDDVSHHVKKILEELGLSPRDFIVRALPDLSVEGAARECFVAAENLKAEILDGRTILEFELSKGSYATMVLKGLFN